MNTNMLLAQGHSRLFFRGVELVRRPLGLALLGLGTLFGTMGIAWSQVVFSVLAIFINGRYTKRHLDYGILRQLQDCAPIFAISLPMAGAVYWIGGRVHLPPLAKLGCLIALGSILFAGLGLACRLVAVRDGIELFRSRRAATSEPKYST
jgi:hypothetical protein